MPQEVINRVNQLGKADAQPELRTLYDRMGRLIGNTEITGLPDPINFGPNNNGLTDLDPPTVNYDYGLDEPLNEQEAQEDFPAQDIDPDPQLPHEQEHEPKKNSKIYCLSRCLQNPPPLVGSGEPDGASQISGSSSVAG
jgi:hypothetical protein